MKHIESTHAQEHWLRLSANAAIERAANCPPMFGDALLELLDCAEMLAGKARTHAVKGSKYVALQQVEAATSSLLRAAVILRREESGR